MKRFEGLFDLRGRVAVVAGGAGAIGSALAEGLAAYGASVTVAGRNEEAAVRVAQDIAEATGACTLGLRVDANDPDSVAALVDHTEGQLGPVSVLVNAVGTHIEQPAQDVTPEAWDRVVDLNLRAAFLLSQGAARAMIASQTPGSILHITSVRSGLGIRRGYAAYVASKGGLALLIKQLATEWAPYQIRVNGIAPTFTRTPLVADYLNDPQFYGDLVKRIPLGRVCETADLVGTAVYLASNASSFVTGQNIFVDGGVTATQ
jgi:gluconate 5-dehydrogenase